MIRGRRMRRRGGLVALLLASAGSASGCYSYEFVNLSAITPPTDVRIVVDPQWALGSGIGTIDGGSAQLTGRLMEERPEALIILPGKKELYAFSAPFGTALGPVTVPGLRVMSVEVKRIDRGKTLMLTGGFGVVVGLVLWNRLGQTGRSGQGQYAPPSDAAILPLVP